MFLVTEWFGTFLVERDGSVQTSLLLSPTQAEPLAGLLARLHDGQVLPQERDLAGKADGEFEVREDRLLSLPGAKRAKGEVPSLVDRAADMGFDAALLHRAVLEL